jgi:LemA protein
MVSLVGQYNRMVGLDEAVDSQWGNVENVYQRRADLIPNLVETVKGYAAHERETLEAVVKARAEATRMQAELDPESLNDPEVMRKFQAVQGELSSALGRLMVVIEKYPELKANEGFRDLQVQLEGTENRIAVERRRFNEQAQGFNTVIRRFPANLVAGMFGFSEKAYFEATEGAETAPKVEF